jgi:hypothetical protein
MSEVNKIANYNQMMSWLTRPASPKQPETREDFAIGSEPETTQAMTGLVDNMEQPIEDTTMGPGGYPMTAGVNLLKLPKKISTGIDKVKDAADIVNKYYKKTGISPGIGNIKKAAEKYGFKLEDWLSKTKKEKASILYRYNNPEIKRDLDSYMEAPDELLTRIEPSAETLAKTNEELIAALRLRRNMNTPEYWSNLEALSKNTGKSVRILEKELAPEGKKVFSFAEKLTARFDKDTIETMFPSAKNLSRVKEFQNIFKSNNKNPVNFSPRGSGSLNYLTEPNLFNKRVELIKNKKLDMNALYSQAELKEIFNAPNFSLNYVESAIPGSVKREGPIVAKKGTPGGVKSGLTSINDVIAAFETKINKKIINPRGIGFAGRKAQQEIDQDLFKVTGESFRKVLSRKIRENSNTKKIEAFTGSNNLDPQITSILQKYDVKIPQIAHLNPVEFAKRKVLSDTTDPTVAIETLLGSPRFPGFSKNLDQLYTTDNLGFQGKFFNNSVVGKQIQFELKDTYQKMQPLITKYQGKKVPVKIQEQIKILNGQVNALLKKSRANQFKFKEEMSGAAKNFEDLYSGSLGKTGPYGEVRLAEDIGKNELKVINLDPKNASPFIKNKSKGALGVSADNFSDLSDSQKVKAKQNWFNNFKGKMLIQIPDANEKKIIEKYLDLYISPLEQRAKNIDPITGKSVARPDDPRRTDTSYNEGGRVGLAEGTTEKIIKGAKKASNIPLKTLAGVDTPLMQLLFATGYEAGDDPFFYTLPAAFTDMTNRYLNLYEKSPGKAKTFLKSTLRLLPIEKAKQFYPIFSKLGKVGSTTGYPFLKAASEGLKELKVRAATRDAASDFKMSPEKMMELRSKSLRKENLPRLEDDTYVPTEQDYSDANNKIKEAKDRFELSMKMMGSAFGLNENPLAEKESIYTRGKENPMSLDRALYPNRQNFADGPEDPSKKGLGSLTKRNFLKMLTLIPAGILAIRGGPNLLKKTEKATEIIKRGADGVPDFLADLIAKVKLKAEATGYKYFTGKSSDEMADVYQADNFVVTEQGNKTIIREVDDPSNPGYRENQIEIEVDPETGGVTYNEASARPDDQGKLKDVDEYIEDVDLENMRKYTYDK